MVIVKKYCGPWAFALASIAVRIAPSVAVVRAQQEQQQRETAAGIRGNRRSLFRLDNAVDMARSLVGAGDLAAAGEGGETGLEVSSNVAADRADLATNINDLDLHLSHIEDFFAALRDESTQMHGILAKLKRQHGVPTDTASALAAAQGSTTEDEVDHPTFTKRSFTLPAGVSHEDLHAAIGQAVPEGVPEASLTAAVSGATQGNVTGGGAGWSDMNAARVKDLFAMAFDDLDAEMAAEALEGIDLTQEELEAMGKILAELGEFTRDAPPKSSSALVARPGSSSSSSVLVAQPELSGGSSFSSSSEPPRRKRLFKCGKVRRSGSGSRSEDLLPLLRDTLPPELGSGTTIDPSILATGVPDEDDPTVINIYMSSILFVRRLKDRQRKRRNTLAAEPEQALLAAPDAEEKAPLDEEGRKLLKTGSFANCMGPATYKKGMYHPDQTYVTISCETLPYRMPDVTYAVDVVIGVLSSAGGDGPARRTAIRETWALQSSAVYFIVAGDWEDVAEEYEAHRDLIWLDEKESYLGIVHKTLLFLEVSQLFAKELDTKFAFKTDDDSFLDVDYLHRYLLGKNSTKMVGDYWGTCHDEPTRPYRTDKWKWKISYELYPEQEYPPYCLGAGYAISSSFLRCAAKHIPHSRHMPFEDVAVGLLAERCGVTPMNAETERMVSNFRTPFDEEKKFVEEGLKLGIESLPPPDMKGKICQHRVFDVTDMYEHYEHLLNPEKYIEARGCWRRCPDYRNIILLDHYGSRGLQDRLSIFHFTTEIAGYLCATVRVPPPRSMLSPAHNDGEFLAPDSKWDDFIDTRMMRNDAPVLKEYETDEFIEEFPHRPYNLTKYFPTESQESNNVFSLPNESHSGWLRLQFSNNTNQHDYEVLEHLKQLENITKNQIDDPSYSRGFVWQIESFDWTQHAPVLKEWYGKRHQEASTMAKLVETLWDEDEEEKKVLDAHKAFPFICKYTRNIATTSWDVAEMVFDSLEDSYPDTDHFGKLYIKTDFGASGCDTSLVKIKSFLTCSLYQVEEYGKITIMYQMDETNHCYRKAVHGMIESLGHRAVDLDILVKSIAEEHAQATNSPHLANNWFVAKVQDEMTWHYKMTFRLTQEPGKDTCPDCEHLHKGWQFEEAPQIAELYVPDEYAIDFDQVLHDTGACERERQAKLALSLMNVDVTKREWAPVRTVAPLGRPTAAFCSCAKCGSTSAYERLYLLTNGRPWNYTGHPWIQQMDEDRWDKANVNMLFDESNFTNFRADYNSYAVIRDPKERILSAYRSKIACYGADRVDRREIVRKLLKLLLATEENIDDPYQVPEEELINETIAVTGLIPGDAVDGPGHCLTQSDFLYVLYQIHKQGKQGYLDQHFFPQHLHCFRNATPAEWDVVVTASAPTAGCLLEHTVNGQVSWETITNGECALSKSHSTSQKQPVKEADMWMLNFVTGPEYDILGPYLT